MSVQCALLVVFIGRVYDRGTIMKAIGTQGEECCHPVAGNACWTAIMVESPDINIILVFLNLQSSFKIICSTLVLGFTYCILYFNINTHVWEVVESSCHWHLSIQIVTVYRWLSKCHKQINIYTQALVTNISPHNSWMLFHTWKKHKCQPQLNVTDWFCIFYSLLIFTSIVLMFSL